MSCTCVADPKDFPQNPKYFKEEIVNEILKIPCQKPDIERILKVVVNPVIVNTRLIETEIGLSNEGQNLTGYKLIIELNFKERLTYVANEKTQSVHAVYFETMKSIFIVLPKKIDNEDVCDLLKLNRIKVTPYIEAIKWNTLSCREVHKCILLLLNVKVC